MQGVILVPRRADGGRRDELWRYCRSRWEQQMPGWPIVEGHHDGGSFNRSAALNAAAAEAGDWEVAVVIDSDVIVDPRQAESAAAVAVVTDAICFGHHHVRALRREDSDAVMAGDVGDWHRFRPQYTWDDGASMCLAVSRVLWDTVGGFDERFAGWGMEDVAFSAACHLLGAGHRRIHGTVWHLWHPTNNDRPQGNVALWERYRRHVWEHPDRGALLALMSEPGGPLWR